MAKPVLISGDGEGWGEAIGRVVADPNPKHLDEYEACTGKRLAMRDILDETVGLSSVTTYRTNGNDAIVCGFGCIKSEMLKAAPWLTCTASAVGNPYWFIRVVREMLTEGCQHLMPGTVLHQMVPENYPEAIKFALYLGFRATRRFVVEATGAAMVWIEREAA